MASFGAAFWWTLGICAVGILVALFLPGTERDAGSES